MNSTKHSAAFLQSAALTSVDIHSRRDANRRGQHFQAKGYFLSIELAKFCALARPGAFCQTVNMQTVTLTAHFDGEHIHLDEPFAISSTARLLVTILPGDGDAEREEWYALAKAGLARAYSDDEPDYPASLVRSRATP